MYQRDAFWFQFVCPTPAAITPAIILSHKDSTLPLRKQFALGYVNDLYRYD